MSDKIKKFPAGKARRERLNLRKHRVACEVSGRWLQFPDKAQKVGDRDFMFIEVMTLGSDDKERKLCELVLSRQDILQMLETIQTQ